MRVAYHKIVVIRINKCLTFWVLTKILFPLLLAKQYLCKCKMERSLPHICISSLRRIDSTSLRIIPIQVSSEDSSFSATTPECPATLSVFILLIAMAIITWVIGTAAGPSIGSVQTTHLGLDWLFTYNILVLSAHLFASL